jgi:hypothetical protein
LRLEYGQVQTVSGDQPQISPISELILDLSLFVRIVVVRHNTPDAFQINQPWLWLALQWLGSSAALLCTRKAWARITVGFHRNLPCMCRSK